MTTIQAIHHFRLGTLQALALEHVAAHPGCNQKHFMEAHGVSRTQTSQLFRTLELRHLFRTVQRARGMSVGNPKDYYLTKNGEAITKHFSNERVSP